MNRNPVGRTLSPSGQPIEGTGFLLDPNSPTLQLLQAQETTLILTNPVTGEIGCVVMSQNEAGEPVEKGLGIMPPGAAGPPEHIHPSYIEEFEVLEGKALFILNGEEHILEAGQRIIVPINTAHTFRPHGDGMLAVLVEARPTGRLMEVVSTIFALGHEGKVGKNGEPNFWQAMAMGADLQDDTLFTTAPIGLQKVLFKIFGPIAKGLGYKSTYPEYLEEEYWRQRVEQL